MIQINNFAIVPNSDDASMPAGLRSGCQFHGFFGNLLLRQAAGDRTSTALNPPIITLPNRHAGNESVRGKTDAQTFPGSETG
ncbi:hypothetical protein RXV95_11085 [Novosphingobium sp. ZN18A2]|uniref:hypothetical protein n=1 Tax=Novosphingobium sp. ZN18A2 TaxID=3079861 RepID=UPI0030D4ADDD